MEYADELLKKSAPKHVLHADDDENDRFLVEISLSDSKLPVVYHCARDGSEAVDYLAGRGAFTDRGRFPFPDVLILDLKMPRMDGFGVLEWLNKRPAVEVPVIVLSSSMFEEDKSRAMQLGAAACVVKNPGFRDLANELVNVLKDASRWSRAPVPLASPVSRAWG